MAERQTRVARDVRPATHHARRDPRDLSHEALAVYAHELRGALTVIAGYTELLRYELSDEERVAALDGIERAIHRADDLCSDALAGKPPLAAHERPQESLSLLSLAEEVAADQRTATGRDIVVTSGQDEAVVHGERDALSRVLANLVGNAVKYSPADTPVEVRIALEQSLTLGLAGVVEVADRGHGVPAAERTRVFEPFERLTQDADTPGSGLGLAVVREVVEVHGGGVEIQERPGGGTIVRVELPAES